MCGVFHGKKRHSAIGAKAVGTGFGLKNKIPDLSAPVRQGFDFQSSPQQDQQTFEVFRTQQIPTICVFVTALLQSRSFNTTVGIPAFHKRSCGFRNAVSSQCFALHSDEKYWVYYSDAGSRSMSLVPHCPTHRHTHRHACI